MHRFSFKSAAVILLLACTGMMDNKPADVTLSLPDGFRATNIIEKLGNNRHIVVHSNGDIYVKLSRLKDGKGI